MTESSGLLVGDPPPPPRRETTVGDRVRFVLRGVGQTLITCGLIILLFVVYEVYVTNYFAHKDQAKVATSYKKEITKYYAQPSATAASASPSELPLPDGVLPSPDPGKGIAELFIPRLGRDYNWTIVEGSTVPTDSQLEKGPAHYADTALPGEVGNFSVAGHRVGKGEPFLNLDQLKPGDPVIVETLTKWYVYRVLGNTATGNLSTEGPDGIPGREIVSPSDGAVISAVPDSPGATPTEKIMTMTTCTPKFSATQRMVVHAVLVNTYTADGLTKPAPIVALYGSS